MIVDKIDKVPVLMNLVGVTLYLSKSYSMLNIVLPPSRIPSLNLYSTLYEEWNIFLYNYLVLEPWFEQ